MGDRARRGLRKTFRREFDEPFAIYEAGVKRNNDATPWPPPVSYVARTFDSARRTANGGVSEDLEMAFLDEALDYAAERTEVDRELLFTAARTALAKRNPRDHHHRRSLEAAMNELEAERARRSAHEP